MACVHPVTCDLLDDVCQLLGAVLLLLEGLQDVQEAAVHLARISVPDWFRAVRACVVKVLGMLKHQNSFVRQSMTHKQGLIVATMS